jgi:hypothetical protein
MTGLVDLVADAVGASNLPGVFFDVLCFSDPEDGG